MRDVNFKEMASLVTAYIVQKMKEAGDLVTFTKDILNGNLHFSCKYNQSLINCTYVLTEYKIKVILCPVSQFYFSTHHQVFKRNCHEAEKKMT